MSPAPSPVREEPLIQAPPRSKWEREDDEEGLENELSSPKAPSPVLQKQKAKEMQPEAPKLVRNDCRDGSKELKRGVIREDKKGRTQRDESRPVRTAPATSDKTSKTKTAREPDREEGKDAAREEGRATGKEERGPDSRGTGGREESRGPEPRRQRLCSDLGRETDEAAFVPDYSEGEGSDTERGRSASLSPSQSQHSHSPTLSNHSGSGATDKKKKKQKKQKKHKDKKKKKHNSQDKGEHKKKHKKKKRKKNKDKDDEEEEVKAEKTEEGAPS